MYDPSLVFTSVQVLSGRRKEVAYRNETLEHLLAHRKAFDVDEEKIHFLELNEKMAKHVENLPQDIVQLTEVSEKVAHINKKQLNLKLNELVVGSKEAIVLDHMIDVINDVCGEGTIDKKKQKHVGVDKRKKRKVVL